MPQRYAQIEVDTYACGSRPGPSWHEFVRCCDIASSSHGHASEPRTPSTKTTTLQEDGINAHVSPPTETLLLFSACPFLRNTLLSVFLSSWRDARGHGATKSALRAHQPFARWASTSNAVSSRGRPQVAFFLDDRECVHKRSIPTPSTLARSAGDAGSRLLRH